MARSSEATAIVLRLFIWNGYAGRAAHVCVAVRAGTYGHGRASLSLGH